MVQQSRTRKLLFPRHASLKYPSVVLLDTVSDSRPTGRCECLHRVTVTKWAFTAATTHQVDAGECLRLHGSGRSCVPRPRMPRHCPPLPSLTSSFLLASVRSHRRRHKHVTALFSQTTRPCCTCSLFGLLCFSWVWSECSGDPLLALGFISSTVVRRLAVYLR